MTEPTIGGGISLLPYLEGRTPGLRLTLAEVAADAGRPAGIAALETAGPFTALWKARITLDGLHTLSEVFLLIQPDAYAQAPAQRPGFGNPQVDTFWQALAGRLQAQDAGRGPVLLSGQRDSQGRLVALRPLFYCLQRQRFAHPFCPQCGQALILCQDDQELQKAGLATYSDSLTRYLYCPACQGRAIFYAHELSSQAPDYLRDARQLVEGFSRLLGREELGDALPCVGCPETTACYGPQTLVHQRMAPLCFYPFHMLMLPAPVIASDYVFKMWLSHLRREIEAPLFNFIPAPAAVAPQPVAAPVTDAADATGPAEADARIAAILGTILSQWPGADAEAARNISAAVPPSRPGKLPATRASNDDGDSLETVILGAAPPSAPSQPAPPPSPDMAQTVLIQRPPPAAPAQALPDDGQETVLIAPAAPGRTQAPAGDDLEKTVWMGAPPEVPKAPADQDELEQTVLMTPSSKPGLRPPQAPPPLPPKMPAAPQPPEADDLDETVIISPDPAKGRRPRP